MPNQNTSLTPRGFAAMDSERQREISSIGGRAAHAGGHAHRFTSEEARAAGRKGGSAVSRDREHMAAIGRRGGRSRSRVQEPDEGASAVIEETSRES
ncbi:general stress protein [Dyella jiangningensis]|uniref:KGG domain-containing protein n=1 Tax=Dyella jiangningensis TaxID=1379159 RepID=UPI00045661FD|nr:general stress protein [Dyella jiangningensis]